ncbi:cytoplasmic protein [Boletus edulis BED1]|uniref:Cytoplasmic protein n=1 Tax=Boletus edulis BED1 TaxID=1328754 RepID=A0AAD4BMK7_BOLED|nr:cytoplasmic protein [Boletus edulis BED1]
MTPTENHKQDLLLSCRFGDLDDVQHFINTFPHESLDGVQDDNGNSVLHMTAANGHTDILAYLLPRVSPSLLTHRNNAGSTALHWAAVNRHLDVAQILVRFSPGPGVDLIDIRNEAGRSPLGEAEIAGWDEGARWFVQVMHLDEVREAEAEEEGEGEKTPVDPTHAIEVEIQDSDGQMARMTINTKPSLSDREPS